MNRAIGPHIATTTDQKFGFDLFGNGGSVRCEPVRALVRHRVLWTRQVKRAPCGGAEGPTRVDREAGSRDHLRPATNHAAPTLTAPIKRPHPKPRLVGPFPKSIGCTPVRKSLEHWP